MIFGGSISYFCSAKSYHSPRLVALKSILTSTSMDQKGECRSFGTELDGGPRQGSLQLGQFGVLAIHFLQWPRSLTLACSWKLNLTGVTLPALRALAFGPKFNESLDALPRTETTPFGVEFVGLKLVGQHFAPLLLRQCWDVLADKRQWLGGAIRK